MNKIEFFKNNILVDINESELDFQESTKTLTKEDAETLIIFDFNLKTCQINLKKESLSLNLEVIEMNYFKVDNTIFLSYILISEPDIKNVLKIALK